MEQRITRRTFLKATTAAGIGVWVSGMPAFAASKSPNEKLNIGVIGCGGRGGADLNGVTSENIVALCDVDSNILNGAASRFPSAVKYTDFRKMLEEQKNLDAVVIGTPDHTHAPATAMAIKLGKHVYCEKPLTHTVYEARVIRDLTKKYKVATQMGNQGHSGGNLRRAVEIIQSGAIGPVHEVHIWSDRPIWPQGLDRPAETLAVPANLDWDLWLGPAPERPFNPAYVPFKWRGWWDFGCGALGDMGCHTFDMPFWALKLDAPNSVDVVRTSGVNKETAPKSSVLRYEFPARGKGYPAVTIYWYDGGEKPALDMFELAPGEQLSSAGSLMVGEKGRLYAPGSYAENYRLLPSKDFEGYAGPKETLPRSQAGHHQEWISACKGGPAALSNFDYATRLTETILLGNVVMQVGHKIEWDAHKMRAKHCPEADQYLRTEYRKGWTL